MQQNYNNHGRFVTGFHRVLGGLIIVGFIGSIINLIKSLDNENVYSASLLVLLFICAALLFWYTRAFPLKAQDRAIRMEENFRYHILTGKTLPADLRMSQIVALRFAPDSEFVVLVDRAVKENLSQKAIKQAIQNWKADHDRV